MHVVGLSPPRRSCSASGAGPRGWRRRISIHTSYIYYTNAIIIIIISFYVSVLSIATISSSIYYIIYYHRSIIIAISSLRISINVSYHYYYLSEAHQGPIISRSR